MSGDRPVEMKMCNWRFVLDMAEDHVRHFLRQDFSAYLDEDKLIVDRLKHEAASGKDISVEEVAKYLAVRDIRLGHKDFTIMSRAIYYCFKLERAKRLKKLCASLSATVCMYEASKAEVKFREWESGFFEDIRKRFWSDKFIIDPCLSIRKGNYRQAVISILHRC